MPADFDDIFARVSGRMMSLDDARRLLTETLPSVKLTSAERRMAAKTPAEWGEIAQQTAYVARMAKGDAEMLLRSLGDYAERQKSLAVAVALHTALIESGASDVAVSGAASFVRSAEQIAARPFQTQTQPQPRKARR